MGTNQSSPHEPTIAVSAGNSIMEDLREAWVLAQKERFRKIPRFNISEHDFKEQLRAHACIIIAERGGGHTFEYDSPSNEIATQLWAYTIGDAKVFKGSLLKGIALVGYFGCGKTLIMEAWGRLVNYHVRELELRAHRYDFYTARELLNLVVEKGYAAYKGGAMIIDELGRETKTVKSWGTESMPMHDLLFERHRLGAITHITANMTLKDFAREDKGGYGEMMADRFKEMFNFIEMKGASRRK